MSTLEQVKHCGVCHSEGHYAPTCPVGDPDRGRPAPPVPDIPAPTHCHCGKAFGFDVVFALDMLSIGELRDRLVCAAGHSLYWPAPVLPEPVGLAVKRARWTPLRTVCRRCEVVFQQSKPMQEYCARCRRAPRCSTCQAYVGMAHRPSCAAAAREARRA